MTLIAGVRGVRKSFLVSDSRATIKHEDGTTITQDNAKKWMHFNQHSTIAVAGDASLGAFIAKHMTNMSSEFQPFHDTKANFDNHLEEAAAEFNQLTGRFTKCAVLLVGYDLTENEDMDARRLGEVMAAGVIRHGEGVSVNQSVDNEILSAMSNALGNATRPLGAGDRVPLGLKKSVAVGYKIDIRQDGVHIDATYADTFESLFYGADSAYNKIEVPDELLSDVYFRESSGMDYQEVLFRDTLGLIKFYDEVIEERQYQGVGGAIFPVMMTEGGGMFYSNEIIRQSRHDGSMHIDRDTKMIDGKMHFKNSNGEYEEYMDLLAIAEQLENANYHLGFGIDF
jgi:hypothetical protein